MAVLCCQVAFTVAVRDSDTLYDENENLPASSLLSRQKAEEKDQNNRRSRGYKGRCWNRRLQGTDQQYYNATHLMGRMLLTGVKSK